MRHLPSRLLALTGLAAPAACAPDVMGNAHGGDAKPVVAAAEAHCRQAANKDAVPTAFNALRGHSVMTVDCR